jgi:integrase
MLNLTKTKTTTKLHNGKRYTLKENGLPIGFGLFWQDAERKYIFAKVHGERFPCKTDDWRVAIEKVEAKRAEHDRRENGVVVGDVLVEELLNDLIEHYESLGRKRGDYKPATAYIGGTQIDMKDGIRETFGDLKAAKLQPMMYLDYRKKWELKYQAQGKTTDTVQYTIDHHLSYLKRALRIGIENRKVAATVPLPKIDKENSRKGTRPGIIVPGRADELIPLLPDWVQPIFVTCYATGIRKKEATFIHRSEINFAERLIHLRPDETKAGKARTLGVPKKYWSLIEAWEVRTRREHPKAEFLFHLDGVQVTEAAIDRAFNAVCETQGWHTKLVDQDGKQLHHKNGDLKWNRADMRWHDTRRTATTTVSNLEGLTDTDIHRTVGLTPETHIRYDKTQSAIKVRDAQDARDAQVPGTATNPSQAATVPGNGKRERLAELKAWFDDGLLDADLYKEQQRAIMAS